MEGQVAPERNASPRRFSNFWKTRMLQSITGISAVLHPPYPTLAAGCIGKAAAGCTQSKAAPPLPQGLFTRPAMASTPLNPHEQTQGFHLSAERPLQRATAQPTPRLSAGHRATRPPRNTQRAPYRPPAAHRQPRLWKCENTVARHTKARDDLPARPHPRPCRRSLRAIRHAQQNLPA